MATRIVRLGTPGFAPLLGSAMFCVLAIDPGTRAALAGPPDTPERLVSTVDLGPLFVDAGLRVRAQGGRNTCSVFAVAGAMEYALARGGEAVKTRNEAHFVRLGIGRAVYAYRLAYGKLPESFELLVKSGIMPERYTKDENGVPLEQHVENGYSVVKSRGEPGWTHRWQGLDARR